MTDKEILDWLDEQVISVIEMDDGTIIDVRGNDIRKAVIQARDNRSRRRAALRRAEGIDG